VLAFNADAPVAPDGTPRVEANQLLDAVFGAERRFLGPIRMEELNAAMERVADELRGAGRRPYVIPIGGSSPLGASAYSAAADEIVEQVGHEDLVIVMATGSGGTQAGLAARLGHDRVMGVDVGALADPGAVVAPLARQTADLVGRPAPSGEPWIVHGQVGEGYGAPTDACRDAIRLAARTEGLLLDPVYSGKAMAGLIERLGSAADRRLEAARTIVFLASGGLPALFASRYGAWLTQ
jgi:D-cysteine desulfhydrase